MLYIQITEFGVPYIVPITVYITKCFHILKGEMASYYYHQNFLEEPISQQKSQWFVGSHSGETLLQGSKQKKFYLNLYSQRYLKSGFLFKVTHCQSCICQSFVIFSTLSSLVAISCRHLISLLRQQQKLADPRAADVMVRPGVKNRYHNIVTVNDQNGLWVSFHFGT